MENYDKKRILDFLSGNIAAKEFGTWVNNNSELESSLGSDFFFDLINIDFGNSDSVYSAKKTLLGKHVGLEELNNFKYLRILEKAGWFRNRKIKLTIETPGPKGELKYARKIISEFGGLELISTYQADYWTPRNIKFPETIERIINGVSFGLNKPLICIAHIDDYNSAIYVDEENNYYQLDDISSVELYRFKGKDFPNVIKNLLGLDEKDNFELVGSSNK